MRYSYNNIVLAVDTALEALDETNVDSDFRTRIIYIVTRGIMETSRKDRPKISQKTIRSVVKSMIDSKRKH